MPRVLRSLGTARHGEAAVCETVNRPEAQGTSPEQQLAQRAVSRRFPGTNRPSKASSASCWSPGHTEHVGIVPVSWEAGPLFLKYRAPELHLQLGREGERGDWIGTGGWGP